MNSLKTAALGMNVAADAVISALKDAAEAKAWLVEADKWQMQLTKRKQVISVVEQALLPTAVKAAAVESAARTLGSAEDWLIEAEAWRAQLT